MFTDRDQEIILTIITLGCFILILLYIQSVKMAAEKHRREMIVAELLQELIFSQEQFRGEKLASWEVDTIEKFAREEVEKDPDGMAQKAKWLSDNREKA